MFDICDVSVVLVKNNSMMHLLYRTLERPSKSLKQLTFKFSKMAADKITFNVKSEGLPGVEKVVIGNMTDPTGITFWAKVDANPWTWGNNGHNVTSFGLVMNYYDTNAGQERTAFHVLDVSPQDMDGDVTVDVVLKPCTIGPVSYTHLTLPTILLV